MNEWHVLNLGAGVQSTTLALLAAEMKLLKPDGSPVIMDCAIFADTQEEPVDQGHSVYSHIEWLRNKLPFPLITRTAGKLGDDLRNGNARGRFASIPAFTRGPNGLGKVKRQCTTDYKIAEVERGIRRDLLGLRPRQRMPSGTMIHQYMGISLDEAGRMVRAKKREQEKPTKWSLLHYPLIEQLGWTRSDCRVFLEKRVPHRVPRSACVFCPFHDNRE